jgi:hypothetical protein
MPSRIAFVGADKKLTQDAQTHCNNHALGKRRPSERVGTIVHWVIRLLALGHSKGVANSRAQAAKTVEKIDAQFGDCIDLKVFCRCERDDNYIRHDMHRELGALARRLAGDGHAQRSAYFSQTAKERAASL